MSDLGTPGFRLPAQFGRRQYPPAFIIGGTAPGANLCHAA